MGPSIKRASVELFDFLPPEAERAKVKRVIFASTTLAFKPKLERFTTPPKTDVEPEDTEKDKHLQTTSFWVPR